MTKGKKKTRKNTWKHEHQLLDYMVVISQLIGKKLVLT